MRWPALIVVAACGAADPLPAGTPPAGTPPAVVTPPPSPVVIPSPPPPPAAPAPRGMLAAGKDASWPADLPLRLDAAWTPTLVVGSPEGSFVQATRAPTPTLAELRLLLAQAGCAAPEEAVMPGSHLLSCPPDATFASLVVRVPDATGPVTIAWRRVTP